MAVGTNTSRSNDVKPTPPARAPRSLVFL
jgi:hypothetical protein